MKTGDFIKNNYDWSANSSLPENLFVAFKNNAFINNKNIFQITNNIYTFDEKFIFKSELKNTKNYSKYIDTVKLKVEEKLSEKYRCIFTELTSKVFLSDNSIAHIFFTVHDKRPRVYMSFIFSDERCYDKFIANFSDSESPGGLDAYVVITNSTGLQLKSIGHPAQSLIKENYNKNVIKNYNYILSQLEKEIPFGRIILMHGVPGTGKTHLIKGFMHSLNKPDFNVRFVFLDPDCLFRYDNSTLLSVIAKNVGTTVLVIEDGDELIVPRKDGSPLAISKLLNMSDGIIGNLLDLRLIITTNALNIEIDEAIKRPGRLCASVSVDKLSPEQANLSYKKITGQNGNFTSPISLAEIYQVAQKLQDVKMELPKNGNGRVGFQL